MTEQAGGFGAVLRGAREAARLSQAELAERAGLSERGLSDLERGARRRPHPETVRRLAAALRLDDAGRVAMAAAARAPVTAGRRGQGSQGLTLPPTSFVGRERELATLLPLVQTTRLVSLLGVGGIGKTRLALEVAERVFNLGRHDVAVVDCAPLSEPSLVLHATAAALGVRAARGRSVADEVVAAIGRRKLVLVLDNCEHLMTACAQLASELLAACRGLRVLATSRQPLGVAGELIWSVPALGWRGPDTGAVRLFLDRARAVAPWFALTEANTAAVAEVCRHLDGIPLAIELAAARVRALGVDELLARLDQRFRLLSDRTQTATPRHQTLQAALDWSYGLLTPSEQALFRRLSVFVGGWTLEAVEAIGADDALGSTEVLDVLTQLVDQSLVQIEPPHDGDGLRYRLLETVRQYAHERLAEGGEQEIVQARHASYFQRRSSDSNRGWSGRSKERRSRCWTATTTTCARLCAGPRSAAMPTSDRGWPARSGGCGRSADTWSKGAVGCNGCWHCRARRQPCARRRSTRPATWPTTRASSTERRGSTRTASRCAAGSATRLTWPHP
jgi:predicted ATPase/DNA-binding XRE family transcriptional regulator